MATDLETGVAELIVNTNIISDVINESATTEVLTSNGPIPSIRKALADNLYFQDPLPWSNGTNETEFNQLRTFTDGTVWWSPSATTINPVPMGATPVGDSNWFPFQDRNLKNNILEEVTRFNIKGTFAAGFTYETVDDVGLDNSGDPWSYTGSLPFTVPAGTVPSNPDYEIEAFNGHAALTNRSSANSHPASAIALANNTQNMQERLTETTAPNIIDFGARVDGVTVDDAAITAARQSNSRSLVYIPLGTCVSDLTTQQKYLGPGRVVDSQGDPNRAFIHIAQGDTEKDIVPIAGIIRQTSANSGWFFIEDSGHAKNGFTSTIAIDPNNAYRLNLNFSFQAAFISAMNVTPDSWYASQGVTTGQGVSVTQMWLEFYKDLVIDINNNAGVGSFSSFFGSDVNVSLDSSTGVITVTHPRLVSTSSQAPQVTMAAISSVSGQVPVVRSYNNTSLTYGMYAPISGSCSHANGQFNVTTSATAVPTVSVVGNEIRIDHQTVRNVALQVTASNNSPFIYSASPSGANRTIVTVRDFSGNVVTPNLDTMSFQYQGQDLVLQRVPYGNCIVRRGACPVRPANLFGNIGNFWIAGTMQV